MAERRMFSRRMLSSDCFLELSPEQQALYFQLSLHADDDGFLTNAKSITRMLGLSSNTLEEMQDAGFLILFESGVVVIRHWRIHNAIRKDRYVPTLYQEEFARLILDSQDIYQLAGTPVETTGCQSGNQASPQERIGKDRSGYDRRESCAHAPAHEDEPVLTRMDVPALEESRTADLSLPGQMQEPNREEVRTYARERNSSVDPDRFYDYYAARSWNRLKSPIQDWKAAFRCWENREKEFEKQGDTRGQKLLPMQMYSQRDYSRSEESVDEMMARLRGYDMSQKTAS